MTATTQTTTSTRTYVIDKTHSEVTFQVRHLVTKVRGRFTDFSGKIEFNQAQPELSSVAFTINTASVDTGTPDRDAHLRTDDFFAAEKYPTITFVSTRVTKKSDERYDVTGTFTIRDVTKRDHAAGHLPGRSEGSLGQRAGRIRERDHDQPEGLRARLECRARNRRLPRRRRSEDQRLGAGGRAVAATAISH